jgi:putative FmdB family regulatory protein
VLRSIAVPIYEYTCKSCNHRFDQLVPTMKADARPVCPVCGSRQTARAMSVFAVGAETASRSSAPGTCARCGLDGPCTMGD